MRLKTNPSQIVSALILAFCLSVCVLAQTDTNAPGAPGQDAQWSSAGKQAIGTSASLESKIWFTLQGGVMTEVYYPDVTVANVHKLQFVVVNPKTKKVETEFDDAIHKLEIVRPDSLSFRQVNTAKSGEWKITKTYTIDPKNNSILIAVNYSGLAANEIYVYYDPSLNNTGMHDTAWSQKNALLASDGDKSSALISSGFNFEEITNGFLGTSDGLKQLKSYAKLTNQFNRAESGNVVQIARLNSLLQAEFSSQKSGFGELILSFGKSPDEALQNAQNSKTKGFVKCQTEYEKGWSDYVKTLPKVDAKYQAQFDMAAMVLKAQEDKTVRGANVASLTIPWGGGANANEDVGGGYHLVWSRDLYQVVTAYMALGDLAAASRALDFLFNIQQKPDGSFPQNSWLDGKRGWGSLQLDEVAYPLILAYQLKRFDRATWENHVKLAADFLVKTGPKTPQERWEEKSGYSPSTIAAEIAGLVCAAEIARKNGDEASATTYLATADDWARSVERWTATTRGKYGDGNYYLRLTENGKPDAGEKTVLNNGAGSFDESEIVDAGFLELVRLGIKAPTDPLIEKSVKVIDEQLKVNTPNGEVFYRYNHDGYGEMADGRRWNWDGKYTGQGRPWPLLTGERGEYELALAESKVQSPKSKVQESAANFYWKTKAKARLDAMLGFANEGLMIPEQVWDKPETPANIDKQFVPELKFGEGTGSATPLAWSMAQFIRLAVNLKAGKNLETPDVVYNRYVKKVDENKIKTATVSPLIEDDKAIFIYRGDAKQVEVASDFTDWQPHHLTFEKIAGTNTQFLTLPFDKRARIEYKFIVDGKWINDPLNPSKIDNGVGSENSVLTMPGYQPTVWDKGELPKLDEFTLNTQNYGSRQIKVYLPPNYSASTESLPVLYMEDGTEYSNKTRAAVQQENLVKAGKVKPFIIVFIDPKDRMKDYWANDAWADFVGGEVVPAVDAKYRTVRTRDGRALLGASLGGVTSVWAALKHPETFARVGGQSSSFWIDDERVVKELARLDSGKTLFKFYFDTGTLEGAEDDRRAVEILRKQGYDVTYQETAAGHNWTAWRDRLADAFVALWR